MIQYPDINPIALAVGPLKVHWYGLMYLIGLFCGWLLLLYRARKSNHSWSSDQVNDLSFYVALGIVIGGRIGYMLFYDLPQLSSQPLSLFQIWNGGMSFHGGFLGVLFAMWLFGRRNKKHFAEVSDFVAPVVPLGLAAGRLGNFINGELWGRVTDVPWAMVFPSGGPYPRHPSQLYEFILEGVVMFTVLWLFSAKPRPRLAVSGLFALLYGTFRIFIEFFRQPDPQYGYIAFDFLTMGQILSIPILITGIILLIYAYRQPRNNHATIS